MTFGTAMILLLSFTALVLGLFVIEPSYTIFRNWENATQEERYSLEKEFYLTYTVVLLIFMIRILSVPAYFGTMQTLVPMIPGAMCLWGVFNTIPLICWSTLFLKFLLPIVYGGWLILVRINNTCKRNPLMRNLMGLYLGIFPILVLDCLIDLYIFGKLSPVEVSCCSSGIDAWPRPIPALLWGVKGQNTLLALFIVIGLGYAAMAYKARRSHFLSTLSRCLTIVVVVITVLSVTEVFTPLILHTPFHFCPFCLFYKSLPSVLFIIFLWVSISSPWWSLLINKLGRSDEESMLIEEVYRRRLWTTSSYSMLLGIAVILLELLSSFISY